jgi:dsRNA-specific ribonuclease
LCQNRGKLSHNGFVTEIAVGGKALGRGEGRSKKQAAQEAAQKALAELQQKKT